MVYLVIFYILIGFMSIVGLVGFTYILITALRVKQLYSDFELLRALKKTTLKANSLGVNILVYEEKNNIIQGRIYTRKEFKRLVDNLQRRRKNK